MPMLLAIVGVDKVVVVDKDEDVVELAAKVATRAVWRCEAMVLNVGEEHDELKTIGNETWFIALNRAIRVGLDLIDPLAHDRNNRRVSDKIPSIVTLKSSNLLTHSKLPLRISNNITIGGKLKKRDCRAWRIIKQRDERWRRTCTMSIVIENERSWTWWWSRW
jgi:hypothetical protein